MKVKSIFKKTCKKLKSQHSQHECHILSLQETHVVGFIEHLLGIVPTHYEDENIHAARLKSLKYHKTAAILRAKMPTSKSARSGDLGEILAYEYIAHEMGVEVPIKKLRWKDSRNMALRGDDVVAFDFGRGRLPLKVFKCESKSRASLTNDVMGTIETALNKFKGRPDPQSMIFIADRLREKGHDVKALQIEKMLNGGYSKTLIRQIAFTFSGNDPTHFHEKSMKGYDGRFSRIFIGIHTSGHQNLINSVYQRVFGSKK